MFNQLPTMPRRSYSAIAMTCCCLFVLAFALVMMSSSAAAAAAAAENALVGDDNLPATVTGTFNYNQYTSWTSFEEVVIDGSNRAEAGSAASTLTLQLNPDDAAGVASDLIQFANRPDRAATSISLQLIINGDFEAAKTIMAGLALNKITIYDTSLFPAHSTITLRFDSIVLVHDYFAWRRDCDPMQNLAVTWGVWGLNRQYVQYPTPQTPYVSLFELQTRLTATKNSHGAVRFSMWVAPAPGQVIDPQWLIPTLHFELFCGGCYRFFEHGGSPTVEAMVNGVTIRGLTPTTSQLVSFRIPNVLELTAASFPLTISFPKLHIFSGFTADPIAMPTLSLLIEDWRFQKRTAFVSPTTSLDWPVSEDDDEGIDPATLPATVTAAFSYDQYWQWTTIDEVVIDGHNRPAAGNTQLRLAIRYPLNFQDLNTRLVAKTADIDVIINGDVTKARRVAAVVNSGREMVLSDTSMFPPRSIITLRFPSIAMIYDYPMPSPSESKPTGLLTVAFISWGLGQDLLPFPSPQTASHAKYPLLTTITPELNSHGAVHFALRIEGPPEQPVPTIPITQIEITLRNVLTPVYAFLEHGLPSSVNPKVTKAVVNGVLYRNIVLSTLTKNTLGKFTITFPTPLSPTTAFPIDITFPRLHIIATGEVDYFSNNVIEMKIADWNYSKHLSFPKPTAKADWPLDDGEKEDDPDPATVTGTFKYDQHMQWTTFEEIVIDGRHCTQAGSATSPLIVRLNAGPAPFDLMRFANLSDRDATTIDIDVIINGDADNAVVATAQFDPKGLIAVSDTSFIPPQSTITLRFRSVVLLSDLDTALRYETTPETKQVLSVSLPCWWLENTSAAAVQFPTPQTPYVAAYPLQMAFNSEVNMHGATRFSVQVTAAPDDQAVDPAIIPIESMSFSLLTCYACYSFREHGVFVYPPVTDVIVNGQTYKDMKIDHKLMDGVRIVFPPETPLLATLPLDISFPRLHLFAGYSDTKPMGAMLFNINQWGYQSRLFFAKPTAKNDWEPDPSATATGTFKYDQYQQWTTIESIVIDGTARTTAGSGSLVLKLNPDAAAGKPSDFIKFVNLAASEATPSAAVEVDVIVNGDVEKAIRIEAMLTSQTQLTLQDTTMFPPQATITLRFPALVLLGDSLVWRRESTEKTMQKLSVSFPSWDLLTDEWSYLQFPTPLGFYVAYYPLDTTISAVKNGYGAVKVAVKIAAPPGQAVGPIAPLNRIVLGVSSCSAYYFLLEHGAGSTQRTDVMVNGQLFNDMELSATTVTIQLPAGAEITTLPIDISFPNLHIFSTGVVDPVSMGTMEVWIADWRYDKRLAFAQPTRSADWVDPGPAAVMGTFNYDQYMQWTTFEEIVIDGRTRPEAGSATASPLIFRLNAGSAPGVEFDYMRFANQNSPAATTIDIDVTINGNTNDAATIVTAQFDPNGLIAISDTSFIPPRSIITLRFRAVLLLSDIDTSLQYDSTPETQQVLSVSLPCWGLEDSTGGAGVEFPTPQTPLIAQYPLTTTFNSEVNSHGATQISAILYPATNQTVTPTIPLTSISFKIVGQSSYHFREHGSTASPPVTQVIVNGKKYKNVKIDQQQLDVVRITFPSATPLTATLPLDISFPQLHLFAGNVADSNPNGVLEFNIVEWGYQSRLFFAKPTAQSDWDDDERTIFFIVVLILCGVLALCALIFFAYRYIQGKKQPTTGKPDEQYTQLLELDNYFSSMDDGHQV